MPHLILYKAEYECPKGHRFEDRANPMTNDNEVPCPHCYSEWVAANVPKAKQVTESVQDHNADVIPL